MEMNIVWPWITRSQGEASSVCTPIPVSSVAVSSRSLPVPAMVVTVPEEDLPVLLPEIEDYKPKGTAPLATATDWVSVSCPECGGPARRETDTMDTFVDSAWYWARYLSPRDDQAPFAQKDAERWMPIDLYVGGPEHAVLHLLYFRFWTKVMQEMGLCANAEPAQSSSAMPTRTSTDRRVIAALFQEFATRLYRVFTV